MSFKHESKKNDTELSNHFSQLKDQKKDFKISWKILSKAKPYSACTAAAAAACVNCAEVQ